jgi:hypothetical protein
LLPGLVLLRPEGLPAAGVLVAAICLGVSGKLVSSRGSDGVVSLLVVKAPVEDGSVSVEISSIVGVTLPWATLVGTGSVGRGSDKLVGDCWNLVVALWAATVLWKESDVVWAGLGLAEKSCSSARGLGLVGPTGCCKRSGPRDCLGSTFW